MSRQRIVFLGPQRRDPTVLETLRSLEGIDHRAPVAVVTAGWEEREREIQEFEDHVGVPAVNLDVYQRVEDVYTRDPGLREAVRQRHDRLRALQNVYRARLAHALDAARELLRRDGEDWLLEPERDDAIAAVRAIDAHHFERVRQIHAEFEAMHVLYEHPLVAQHREEIRRIVADCSVLCIAGGHVAILLNRLRTLDLMPLWTDRPIVAWSAGAMALTERIVLFHDSPPQGPGDAEVLEAGLGIAAGIVPLPHAQKRLALDDPARVKLFARRFGPARCVALVPGARVDWDRESWRGTRNAQELAASGALAGVPA